MMDREKLVDKLSHDVKKMENKIEYIKLYNIRNAIIKTLIKSGIIVDYALPFLLSTIIVSSFQFSKNNPPFIEDEISVKARIETIDTSNGGHIEHLSYDFEYSDKMIQYSTGWTINERGLYQRTITSYRLNNNIDLSDTDKVLAMSKEEIDNILVITNIQTIQKNSLSAEDYIYSEDALIIIDHTISDTEMIFRKETFGENVLNSTWFIVVLLSWGINIKFLESKIIKEHIRDVLKKYEPLFNKINKEEMEKILELRKQNLEMLTSSEEIDKDNNCYAYRLRKF